MIGDSLFGKQSFSFVLPRVSVEQQRCNRQTLVAPADALHRAIQCDDLPAVRIYGWF